MHIAGLILAGGQSRRMGNTQKAFLPIGGQALLQHIVRVLAPQCGTLMASISRDGERFSALGLITIADERRLGPMAALAGALDWIAIHHPDVTHVLSAPADTPFLPPDLCERLAAAFTPGIFCVCAASGGRRHPVIALWPVAARTHLQAAVTRGRLSFHAALEGHAVADMEWPAAPRDPFFNINTPEDLTRAEAILRSAAPLPGLGDEPS